MASAPNKFIVRANNITSTASGTNDIAIEGCFAMFLSIIFIFLPAKIHKTLKMAAQYAKR
jgi:hypothetical protein